MYPIRLNANINTVLFDMDGVLCDSEIINVLCHQYSVDDLSLKYEILHQDYNADIIKDFVQGVPYLNGVDNIMKAYPKLNRYREEYLELSEHYFTKLKNNMQQKYKAF